MTANPLYLFFASEKNTGPLLLRLALAGLFLCHAGKRCFGWFPDTELLVSWTSIPGPGPSPALIMTLTIAEILFGFLLFLGLFTRLTALGSALLLGAFMSILHWSGSAAELHYPLALTLIALSLVFLGSGRFSMDRAIAKQLLPTIG